jgi:CheY-like chemotaxis protein
MLRRSIGSGVLVTRSLMQGLWPAITDPAQLELAVLNLAINARDAMPSGGTLTIRTENVAKGDPHLPPELSGDCVMVALTDTGTGMIEEVRQRVFEPFFTTKEIGKGTGLGLSMVYGFVQQCGGGARIDSTVGKGTTVAMFFPRASDLAANADEPQDRASAPVAKRRDLQVLVVDDDPEVRDYAAAALSDAGYAVLTAGDAWTALEILDREKNVSLLVTDFSMPVVTGIALMKQVHRERPELPALLITGMIDVPVNELPPGKRCILKKPFDIDELLCHVADALADSTRQKDLADVA